MRLLQFLVALVISAGVVSAASLLWPRFNEQPRPAALQYVRDYVVTTPLGSQAAHILGVSDERNVTPADLGTVVSSIAGDVATSVGDRTQQYIAKRVAEQFMLRINALPEEQKQYVTELLCTPE